MKTPDATIELPSQPNLKLLGQLNAAQNVAFVFAAVIAMVVLCGWLIPIVGSILPDGWSLMKANTALVILLSVTSLVLTQPRRSDRRLLESRIFASLVLILAGTALLGHLTGRRFALDTLLAADPGSDMPGRMSLQTASFFIILGLNLFFRHDHKKPQSYFVDALTITLIIIILVLIAGYVFGASKLFGQSVYTRTSPQTLVCMVLLVFAVTVRRVQSGFFAVLVGVGIGSNIIRLALPFALALPFLIVGGGAYAALKGWASMTYAAALTASLISLLLFVFVIAMAWRINSLERGLREMSLTDELTKVYNRRGFYLLGEYAMREERRGAYPLTVLFFDLDELKKTNDALGHDVGSQLVLDFANLLRTTFRSNDVVARVGGDEFAVVARAHETEMQTALQRLEDATAALNDSGKKPYRISYSSGIATIESTSSESFDALVARADAMMYERKRQKKSSRQAGDAVNNG